MTSHAKDPPDSGIRFIIEQVRPPANPSPSRDTSFRIGGGISNPPKSVEQLEPPKMLNNSRPEHPENVEQKFVEQSPERLVHIGVRVPTSMLAEIDAVALTNHDSLSEVVRRLLRRALDAEARSR